MILILYYLAFHTGVIIITTPRPGLDSCVYSVRKQVSEQGSQLNKNVFQQIKKQ